MQDQRILEERICRQRNEIKRLWRINEEQRHIISWSQHYRQQLKRQLKALKLHTDKTQDKS